MAKWFPPLECNASDIQSLYMLHWRVLLLLLLSQGHDRAVKQLANGTLKLQLDSNGEEVEETETHAERCERLRKLVEVGFLLFPPSKSAVQAHTTGKCKCRIVVICYRNSVGCSSKLQYKYCASHWLLVADEILIWQEKVEPVKRKKSSGRQRQRKRIKKMVKMLLFYLLLSSLYLCFNFMMLRSEGKVRDCKEHALDLKNPLLPNW